jgi:hypothetical protein
VAAIVALVVGAATIVLAVVVAVTEFPAGWVCWPAWLSARGGLVRGAAAGSRDGVAGCGGA